MKTFIAIVIGIFVGAVFDSLGLGLLTLAMALIVAELWSLRQSVQRLEAQQRELKNRLTGYQVRAEIDGELKPSSAPAEQAVAPDQKEAEASPDDLIALIEQQKSPLRFAGEADAEKESLAAVTDALPATPTQLPDVQKAKAKRGTGTLSQSRPLDPDPIAELFDRITNKVKAFFTEGNPLVRIGSLVMLVAVALLLKYVGERVEIPVELRLLGVSLLGLGLIIWGWRLRESRPQFSLPIQGAGFGTLYLTIFASFNFYQVLSAPVALFLMCVCVLGLAVFALLQNAQVLAVTALFGGFIAPILIPFFADKPAAIFTYYLLLNIGVLGIVWRHPWRAMFRCSFGLTFIFALVWVFDSYQIADYAVTQFFLIAHVMLYMLAVLKFSQVQYQQNQLLKENHKKKMSLKGQPLVDSSIVFGTAFLGFVLQVGIMQDFEYPVGYSALGFGLLYGLAALGLKLKNQPAAHLLTRVFAVIAAIFFTIMVPDFFSDASTQIIWSIEGACALWLGLKQKEGFPRMAGYGLTLIGCGLFFADTDMPANTRVFFNQWFLHILVIVVAAWVSVRNLIHYHKNISNTEESLGIYALSLFATAWLVGGGVWQLQELFDTPLQALAGIVLLVCSAAIPYALTHWQQRKHKEFIATGFFIVLGSYLMLFLPLTLFMQQGWDIRVFDNSWFLNIGFLNITLITTLLLGWSWMSRASESAVPIPKNRNLQLFSQKIAQYKLAMPKELRQLMTLSAGLVWFAGLVMQCDSALQFPATIHVLVFLSVLSCLGFYKLSNILNWRELRLPIHAIAPLFWLVLLILILNEQLLHQNFAWVFWAASAVLGHFLAKQELSQSPHNASSNLDLHAAFVPNYGESGKLWHWQNLYFFITLLTYGFTAWVNAKNASLSFIALGTVLAGFVFLLSGLKPVFSSLYKQWPLKQAPLIYSAMGLIPVVVFLGLWLFLSNFLMLDAYQQGRYLPLLNMHDGSSIFVLAALWYWQKQVDWRSKPERMNLPGQETVIYVMGGLAFFALNMSVLRLDVALFNLPFNAEALLGSYAVQMSLTILWIVSALSVMLFSNKQQKRQLWMVGAAMLGITLVKLLLVDTAGSNTIERIVAFFAVAIGYMAAGYFVPRPPELINQP